MRLLSFDSDPMADAAIGDGRVRDSRFVSQFFSKRARTHLTHLPCLLYTRVSTLSLTCFTARRASLYMMHIYKARLALCRAGFERSIDLEGSHQGEIASSALLPR